MDFKTYWSRLTTEKKIAFAKKMETTTGYLSQCANGHANPGPSLRHRMKEALPRGTLVPQVTVRKPTKTVKKKSARGGQSKSASR